MIFRHTREYIRYLQNDDEKPEQTVNLVPVGIMFNFLYDLLGGWWFKKI